MTENIEWANATYHLQEARDPLDALIEGTPEGYVLENLIDARNRLEQTIDLVTKALELHNA